MFTRAVTVDCQQHTDPSPTPHTTSQAEASECLSALSTWPGGDLSSVQSGGDQLFSLRHDLTVKHIHLGLKKKHSILPQSIAR
ncbi:hypothetical protein RRG08_049227 [Elysia crispata]|uniref:Uncharacterized protein n=1 Tax=Elysia crispata TaxID=231223 RepID=A0AAE1D4H4_9GAST|nr:hypothetical protein RRG08_049227 [Elysia crispata]